MCDLYLQQGTACCEQNTLSNNINVPMVENAELYIPSCLVYFSKWYYNEVSMFEEVLKIGLEIEFAVTNARLHNRWKYVCVYD